MFVVEASYDRTNEVSFLLRKITRISYDLRIKCDMLHQDQHLGTIAEWSPQAVTGQQSAEDECQTLQVQAKHTDD